MSRNLLILGAGGHGRVVSEVANAMGIFTKIDFLDDNPESDIAIGLCSEYKKFAKTYRYAFPAFGNNELRIKWLEELEKNCFAIPTLVHPTAYISPSSSIGNGTVVEAKAIVNTNAFIERGCIIDAGAIIDHDTTIGLGCHIDCGAIVKARCVVEAFTKINSGMVVTR